MFKKTCKPLAQRLKNLLSLCLGRCARVRVHSPVRRRHKFPTWPARLRKTHDIRAVAASHIVSSSPYETQYYCAAFLDAGQCKCFNFLFAFCFNPKGVHYYCAALQDAGECKCLIFLLFWFWSARHALLMRSPSGCRGTQMFFLSFLPLVSIREAHTTTAQQSGMQENAKDFCFLFAFCFDPRGTHCYCAALRDAGECFFCLFLFAFDFNPGGT